ncbi:MAG TPA: glycosyltransferase family 1 protein [Thermoanaerobaculaceae bacterium]|nr:glycosyltransferase family 1 protein [Thermoanaerobaculaceae bacterium]
MRRLGIDARKLADYGIGSYLQGLLGEFARRDPPLDLVLLVSRESMHLLPPLPESWRLVEVEAPGYSFREQVALLGASVRSGIDVLHVPHYVIPLVFSRRLVVTVHDIIHVLFPEFLPHPLGFAYARFFIRAAVRKARCILTGSEATASDLKRLFGATEHRLHVVPHGVSPELLAEPDPEEDAAIRRRLGVPDRFLLHVGNHKPHKNAEGLLKAYQIMAFGQRLGPPPLVLVGGFTPGGPLAQRAANMGLGGKVMSLGYVERRELIALYRGATLFVYPTLYEGFGLPVLEAMACGAPVLAGEVAAVREVAGDAVVTVNPRDLVELANAVRRLLDRPELLSRLREKGRVRAREFSWRRAAEATLSTYLAVRGEP